MRHKLVTLFLLTIIATVSSEECPQSGIFYTGTNFTMVGGLPRGWHYWHSCADLCKKEPKCNFWSTVHEVLYSDHNRQKCYLFESITGTRYPDHENILYYSGLRNCTFIELIFVLCQSFDYVMVPLTWVI